MSKIYDKYLNLKRSNQDSIYLFKSGIFLIAIDDDALFLSELFNLKLTNLNLDIKKCGFPISNLSKYINVLDKNNISYKIIDNYYSNVDNPEKYLESETIKNVVNQIINLDLDSLSPKDTYNLLYTYQNKLRG